MKPEPPRLLLVSVLAVCVLLVGCTDASAWGSAGHSIIAEIAQRRLPVDALSQLRALLGSGVSLASVGGWADAIAQLRPETFRLHFVNIPADATSYLHSRDCCPSDAGDCIVAAISRYESVLSDPSRPSEERGEALRFLVHLVADAHQPLHCIDLDDGGSLTEVTFFGVPTTLHQIWDVGLIERMGYDWGRTVDELQRRIAVGSMVVPDATDPALWVEESHRAAVTVAFGLPHDRLLDDDYVNRALPVLEERLAAGGVRLAAVLARALAAGSG